MNLATCIHLAFWCSVTPAGLFLGNLLLYREPTEAPAGSRPAISVLIPARNEEENIGDAIASVLASTGVELELIVLDDDSTDRTAAILEAYAARDGRVRAVEGPALPASWAGKAHAAHVLAGLAQYPVLCFIDADVRLAPAALARMHAFLEESQAALVSGFPQQQTVTFLETLLLPLMHFLLLSYLPLAGMRRFRASGFGAGCGQFLMLRRDAYRATGGYSSIRASMHDGIAMAKLFRRHGFGTDLADLTHLACCRMYHDAGEVWNGLLKNATEGLAAPARIVPFTFLLLCGSVLPWLILIWCGLVPGARSLSPGLRWRLLAALAASLLPRALGVVRFRQPRGSAALHPLGITVLLALQWYALGRKLLGLKVTWKERAFSVG